MESTSGYRTRISVMFVNKLSFATPPMCHPPDPVARCYGGDFDTESRPFRFELSYRPRINRINGLTVVAFNAKVLGPRIDPGTRVSHLGQNTSNCIRCHKQEPNSPRHPIARPRQPPTNHRCDEKRYGNCEKYAWSMEQADSLTAMAAFHGLKA